MTRRNLERDNAILDLTGRYGIGLRIVYERFWFRSGNAGNVIQRLLKEKRLLTVEKGFKGNRSYYQLSPQENSMRGFPSSHADSLEGSRLNERLATLWFATMRKKPRPLLTSSELLEQFGINMSSNVSYCVQQNQKKEHVVLRLRLTGEKMEPADVVRWLKQEVAEAQEDETLADWLEGRQYGYAILVDDPSLEQTRVKAIKSAVSQSGLRKKAFIEIDFAPSTITIDDACQQLRSLKNGKKESRRGRS